MEKERVNLYVTKEHLELICNSVDERRSLWKRTLDYHMGNEDVVGEIEECSHENEAEYVLGLYEELHILLETKIKEIGANVIEPLADDYLALPNESVEIIKLTRGKWQHVVFIYNHRGLDYYFFESIWEMIQYFDIGKEPQHIFGSDTQLDTFLRHWVG